MGIRVALGASPRDVMRLVLTHSVRITFVGILLGLAGALALARLIAGIVRWRKRGRSAIYFSAAVVLGAAILLASYLPARRAMRGIPWSRSVMNEVGTVARNKFCDRYM